MSDGISFSLMLTVGALVLYTAANFWHHIGYEKDLVDHDERLKRLEERAK